ncbi:MAG: hypothetical protein ACKVS8_04280 [Phycisphaerales bacterium]
MFDDAARLLACRLTRAIIAGAHCAGWIARGLSDGHSRMMDLYRRVPARSRCLMLRFATTRTIPPDPITLDLIRAGLADRSKAVRLWAAEAVASHGEGALSEALADAASRENVSELAAYMSICQALADTGYYLGPCGKDMLHEFMVITRNEHGTSWRSMSIPALAFESSPHSKVIDLYRARLRPGPDYASAEQATAENWRKWCVSQGVPVLSAGKR